MSYSKYDIFNYCRAGDVSSFCSAVGEVDFNIDDIISDGFTCLYVACLNGHVDVVNELIIRGADVKKNGANGCFPLFASIQKGHLECAKALIDAGADVNARDLRVGSSSMYLSFIVIIHYYKSSSLSLFLQDILQRREGIWNALSCW